jgi:hypothetical protein
METQELLTELLDLAGRLGMEVRRVPLGGEGGGLCQLRGKSVLFVDSSADHADQVARTAAALSDAPGIESSYLLPQVRQVLEAYRERS